MASQPSQTVGNYRLGQYLFQHDISVISLRRFWVDGVIAVSGEACASCAFCAAAGHPTAMSKAIRFPFGTARSRRIAFSSNQPSMQVPRPSVSACRQKCSAAIPMSIRWSGRFFGNDDNRLGPAHETVHLASRQGARRDEPAHQLRLNGDDETPGLGVAG